MPSPDSPAAAQPRRACLYSLYLAFPDLDFTINRHSDLNLVINSDSRFVVIVCCEFVHHVFLLIFQTENYTLPYRRHQQLPFRKVPWEPNRSLTLLKPKMPRPPERVHWCDNPYMWALHGCG